MVLTPVMCAEKTMGQELDAYFSSVRPLFQCSGRHWLLYSQKAL